MKLIVGSRESTLAVMQTQLVMDEIKRCNPNLELELKTFKTTGDKILDRPLDLVGGKGLFVKELDQALACGEIDLAVHSLKDVPMEVNEELPIVALVKRGDPRDVLVYAKDRAIKESSILVIGSSSSRRRLQIKALYPDCEVKGIRGNIQTRLKKLDDGEFDAIILAAAGLQRANLAHRIDRSFSVNEMLPAAGQGILAVQARKDFDRYLIQGLNDEETDIIAQAERAFVQLLDGGCSSPVAAYAKIEENQIDITGLYYNEMTEQYYIESIRGEKNIAKELGIQLARSMKKKYQGE